MTARCSTPTWTGNSCRSRAAASAAQRRKPIQELRHRTGCHLARGAVAGRERQLHLLRFRLLDYATALVDSTGTLQPVVYNDKLMPTIPRSRITAEVVTRPLSTLSLGLQLDWQSQMFVETGNLEEGVIYYDPPGPQPLGPVPFKAVPAPGLIQLNAHYQVGPAAVFASVDNLFGVIYTNNVIANADNGAYYEAGSGTWVSLGRASRSGHRAVDLRAPATTLPEVGMKLLNAAAVGLLILSAAPEALGAGRSPIGTGYRRRLRSGRSSGGPRAPPRIS